MAGTIIRVILLASALCSIGILSKELYVIHANAQTCKVLDREFVKSVTCKSKNVNRTMNLGSREYIYQPGVSLSNYYNNVVIYRKFGLIYRQFMLNINIDVCDMLAGSAANASALAKMLNVHRRRQFGNMHDPCPITGRRYETNVTWNYESLPEIIPAGEYRVDVTSYTYVNGMKKKLIFVRNMGEVKTTTAEQWK